MNQISNHVSLFFKKLLFVFLTSCSFFFLLSWAITYFLKKIPHFENLYNYVPWLITALLALFLALLSKSAGKDCVSIALISSGIIGVLSVVIGIFLGIAREDFPLVLTRNVLFVGGSFLLSLYFSGKKQKRRASGKKFKFSK